LAYPFDSDNFPYGGVFNENYTAAAALALSVEQTTTTAASMITITGGAGGTSLGDGGTGGSVTTLDTTYSASRGSYSGGDGGTGGGALGNGAGGGGAAGYSGAGGDAGSDGTGGAGGGGGASTNQLLLGGGGVGLFGEGTPGSAGTASAAAGGGSPGGSDSAQGGFDGYFDSNGAQPVYVIPSSPAPPTGLSSSQAATSALQILSNYPSSTDGVYWIDLPTVGPTQIYCIMNSSYYGGGWMLAMKATRGTTFNFTSSYWETNNTLNPTAINLNDGDAKYNSYNYFQGTDIMARFPDVTAGGTLGTGLGAWTWHENSFYSSGQATTLLNHFTNTADNTYLLQDAAVTSWDGHSGGPFSSQGGWRRYGFNIDDGTGTGQSRARWGFSWNNEASPGSNDVAGGIGVGGYVYTTPVSMSAGDQISCCTTYNGANRTMRFEMYIR